MPSTEYRLTTVDNPYSPFTQFNQWFIFDVERGYNTCGLIARIANIPPDMSEEEQDEKINAAINNIIKYDPTNNYRRVTK